MPRPALIALSVASALAVLVLAVIAGAIVDYGTCSGDGGSPFSAGDSVAGGFCDGPFRLPWAIALLVVPVGVVAVLAARAVKRSRGALLAVAVTAGVGAVVVLAGSVAALPRGCSSSDQRAYDRWVDGGRGGQRPADCETY